MSIKAQKKFGKLKKFYYICKKFMAMKKIINFFKKIFANCKTIGIVNIIVNFFRITKKQNMKNNKGFKSIIQMLLNLINFDKLDIELTIDYNADDPQQWDIYLEIWYNGRLIKVFEFTKDINNRKVGAKNTKLRSKLPHMEIEKFINDEIKNI